MYLYCFFSLSAWNAVTQSGLTPTPDACLPTVKATTIIYVHSVDVPLYNVVVVGSERDYKGLEMDCATLD